MTQLNPTAAVVLILTIHAVTIFWFEVFSIGSRLKKLFGKPLHEFTKPFDCRFCTNFWIGTLFCVAGLFFFDYFTTFIVFITNIAVSNIYDRLNN